VSNMHRFFIKGSYTTGDELQITGDDYHHIANSLRLLSGDRVILSNGKGDEYLAKIDLIENSRIICEVIEVRDADSEPNLQVFLAQGLPKKSKLDLIVEKCTELGFVGLYPLETERTIVQYSGSKKERKRERWQRVAEAAAKQSGRAKIPEIYDFKTLNDLITIFANFDRVFLCWEEANNYNIKQLLAERPLLGSEKILLIIGPEGGLSEQEAEQIKNADGEVVGLGPRILRTETAGMAALTCLLYENGDLGGN